MEDELRRNGINEAMEVVETVPELEGGHDEVFGGSEVPPVEEVDEVTGPSSGGEEADESSVQVELPDGGGATIREVRGFERPPEEICCPPECIPEMEAGGEVPEIVHGADDRVRVWNTTSYPWRTIAHLEITASNGRRFTCTGSFIGPRVVLTAGHCLFLHAHGGWPRQIEVIPGRNASSKPYGSAVATQFISVNGWVKNRNSNYDYGVIVLPSNKKLGNTVGWMGLANLSFFSLLGLRVNNSGYPGDKPSGTQWWNSNSILMVTSRRLYYRIDTAGGQSGSPVWRYKNGQRHIVGIHTTGASMWNGATRVCKPVFDNLVKWKNM